IDGRPRSFAPAAYAAAVAILLVAALASWNRSLRSGILQRTAALGESEQRFRRVAEELDTSVAQLQPLARRLMRAQDGEQRRPPPFLDEPGLLSALRWYAAGFAERSGIRVDLQLPERFERPSLEIETALFRIVQESLINIHRHADSETARICLRRDTEMLELE